MHFTTTSTTTATTTATPAKIATLRRENNALINARAALFADNNEFCEQYKNLDARRSGLQAQMNKLRNDGTRPEWEDLLAAYEEVSAEFTRMAARASRSRHGRPSSRSARPTSVPSSTRSSRRWACRRPPGACSQSALPHRYTHDHP